MSKKKRRKLTSPPYCSHLPDVSFFFFIHILYTCHDHDLLITQTALVSSPGILRLRSQTLPTVATEAALWRRLILSRIRPSPVTFTLKGLPVERWEISENVKGRRLYLAQSPAVLHIRGIHSVKEYLCTVLL